MYGDAAYSTWHAVIVWLASIGVFVVIIPLFMAISVAKTQGVNWKQVQFRSIVTGVRLIALIVHRTWSDFAEFGNP